MREEARVLGDKNNAMYPVYLNQGPTLETKRNTKVLEKDGKDLLD
jgi:hypothetical protein